MIAVRRHWYWGIDRLPYLEAELAQRPRHRRRARRRRRGPRPSAARSQLSDKPLTCELWFSFRSPYSYLALEQIEAVLAPYDVPLVLRADRADGRRAACRCRTVKRMYIVRDAKREADRLGIPFGELCDPLGTGVDNCLAIAHWADQRGAADGSRSRARRCAASGPRRATSAEYVDLRHVVERAGPAVGRGARRARRPRRRPSAAQAQRRGSRGDRPVGRAVVPVRRLRGVGPGSPAAAGRSAAPPRPATA